MHFSCREQEFHLVILADYGNIMSQELAVQLDQSHRLQRDGLVQADDDCRSRLSAAKSKRFAGSSAIDKGERKS